MNVTAVTTWNTDCGIAEYAALLQEACAQEQLDVQFRMEPRALDPTVYFSVEFQKSLAGLPPPDVVWLNYHAGLHSRWSPSHVQQIQAQGIPVVITYHDTYDGELSPNSPVCVALYQAADVFIVHEPVFDLEKAVVLRQGVPDLRGVYVRNWADYGGWERPVLGAVGFPFPWKNYPKLAEVTYTAGWGLMVIAPRASEVDVQRLRQLNPWSEIIAEFLPRGEVVSRLAGCTASAFLYECYNTGTSGAIRQGIAARKPVYAFKSCRQFRDLLHAELIEEPAPLIRWVDDWAHMGVRLKTDPIVPWDAGIIALAERDSWRRQAHAYAALFTHALERRRES